MNIFRNSRTAQVFFQLTADVIAIWIGFALQLYIRFFSGLIEVIAHPNLQDYVLGSSLMTFFWIIVFLIGGIYKNWYIRSPFAESYAIIKVVFIGCILIVFFLFSGEKTSFRLLFFVYFGIMSVSFVTFRFIARKFHVMLRRKKIIRIPTIVVGNAKKSTEFYNDAIANVAWGNNVTGIILFNEPTDDDYAIFEKEQINKDIILGTVNNFNDIIASNKPEEVVFSSGTPNFKILFEIESICTANNIRVLIEPNLYDHFTGQSKTQSIYGIPLIEVSSRIMKTHQLVIKRLFDIVFSLMVIVFGLPVWILVGIIIKLESSGKIIYSQPRVGKNNKIFTIYKFRSMAQTKCADPDNPKWTRVGDPRVTKFGKFMRKTHLDEVPQFYNVLIGDMSIVGPRPEQPKFVEEFASQLSYYNRRHIVRPGITGWWQVKYKSHVLNLEEIKKRTKDDFYYIENLSLQLDFEILVRTVWCVLSGHGQA